MKPTLNTSRPYWRLTIYPLGANDLLHSTRVLFYDKTNSSRNVPKTLQWIKTTQFYLLGFVFISGNNSTFNIIVLFFFFLRGWLVLVLRLLWHLKYFNFCAKAAKVNTFSFLEISIIWRSGRTNNTWQELHPPSPRSLPLECTSHAVFPYVAKELYLDICHLQLFFLKNQR